MKKQHPHKTTKKGISLLQIFGTVIAIGVVLVVVHHLIYGY